MGSKNYRIFCVLIVVLEINTALIIILESVFLRDTNSVPIKIFSIIDIAICGVIEIGNGYLIMFHIWLKFNNLTTYQHILNKRAKTNSKIIQSPPYESPKLPGNILTTECQSNLHKGGATLRNAGGDENIKFIKEIPDHNNSPWASTGKL